MVHFRGDLYNKELLMKYAYLLISAFLVSSSFAGVTKITSKSQLSGPAVVKIYAKWCGACKGVAGAYKKLSNDISNVTFYEVDYDEAPNFVSIQALPTFVFFDANRNQVGGTIVGAEIEQVKQKVQSLAGPARAAQVAIEPTLQVQELEMKMVEIPKQKEVPTEGFFGMVGSFFSFLTDSLAKIICGIVAFVKGIFKR